MNSKIFELKNKLNVLDKFTKLGKDLYKNYETLRINQKEHAVQSVENVIKLCKISSQIINCETSSKVKERTMLKCYWPKCQYKSKWIKNLNRHKSRHINERRFVCDFSECN